MFTIGDNCSKLVHFEAQKYFLCLKSPSLEQFLLCSTTKNRNDPVCVVSPKVAKATKTLVAVAGVIAKKCRQCK